MATNPTNPATNGGFFVGATELAKFLVEQGAMNARDSMDNAQKVIEIDGQKYTWNRNNYCWVPVKPVKFIPEDDPMHKRLCKRAQEYIHELAQMMVMAVWKVNARFAGELKPHCEHLLWCPEKKHSCGRYPTKEELLRIIAVGKEALNGKGNPEA